MSNSCEDPVQSLPEGSFTPGGLPEIGTEVHPFWHVGEAEARRFAETYDHLMEENPALLNVLFEALNATIKTKDWNDYRLLRNLRVVDAFARAFRNGEIMGIVLVPVLALLTQLDEAIADPRISKLRPLTKGKRTKDGLPVVTLPTRSLERNLLYLHRLPKDRYAFWEKAVKENQGVQAMIQEMQWYLERRNLNHDRIQVFVLAMTIAYGLLEEQGRIDALAGDNR